MQLAIPGRMDAIKEHQGRGGSIAAVFPIHYSRALLRVFNFLPVEVWGPPGLGGAQGAAHLQPYVCSIVHNAINFLQTGGLQVADVLVVPHACDSLQGLGSILIDFVRPEQTVLPLYLPRGRRASDLDFFTAELRSLFERLAEITDYSPSDEDLMDCVQREEFADDMLARLHQQRRALPLPDISFYRLVRSREYLPAERFTELAELALAQPGSARQDDGIPLLLSGILPEPMRLLEAFSEVGAFVAADDLACCGRRLYPPGESEEPFRRMAERLLNSPPDSTRGDSIKARCDHLLQLVQTSGARGVVFYEIKFCEPELFDLPLLRKALAEAEIASIAVEVDINEPLPQRALTRLEAFVEMIA
jgi:benzoyl-CoA reductase/2-hydroxyglutaryl-CoA dehydratase subunit BcrC/BadD/HgdB